jgi:uncharacterized surface protein with fasciclin (FAS1) repeats
MGSLNTLAFAVAMAATAFAQTASAKDIVDLAAGNPNFTTLVAAVKAADLVDT